MLSKYRIQVFKTACLRKLKKSPKKRQTAKDRDSEEIKLEIQHYPKNSTDASEIFGHAVSVHQWRNFKF